MPIDHPRYATGETLGEGAQGRVVRVIDRERPELSLVAKIVRSDGAIHRGAGEAGQDIEGEFALLARLRVPGLVRVHDLARDARGVCFLVEDFAPGTDPITFVRDGGDRDSDRAGRLATLASDLAQTLAAIHDAGFVHGDVKPGNVRAPDGASGARAMLIDLGASVAKRAERVGEPEDPVLLFTPAFAAPEVRAGAQPTPAADLFGLGATLWACATGGASRHGALRDEAPWVPPRLADLIAGLVAEHPADRPRTARHVLAELGRSAVTLAWESGAREAHVRETEVAGIAGLHAAQDGRRVVYVHGPSGAGKSHLVREALTRALLVGREARLVTFPECDGAFVRRLVAFLRGGGELFGASSAADSSGSDSRGAPSLLLVLDDLHAAPVEVVEALESFRCMPRTLARPIAVVATTRHAPARAEAVHVGPLDHARFEQLCRVHDAPNPDALAREAGGLPGWLFASLGRVPLTVAAALARLAHLSVGARELLGLVATLGGSAPRAIVLTSERSSLDACFQAGLLERDHGSVRLASQKLAVDLAAALASYAITDRATAFALSDESLPAASLASIARSTCPPSRRADLLLATAERARREGARSLEIEALLALVADARARAPMHLVRLERLTRDAGVARAHPQVLAWLEEASRSDASLAPLASRRRAEDLARAGDMTGARVAAARALELCPEDTVERAYALATQGAVALWSADFRAAADAFALARELIASRGDGAEVDREEVARLEHNLGVVALYRGAPADAAVAFERSVTIKRALGDRPGVRACLLNLGLALTRLGRWTEAEAALAEATALAEVLGQDAGRGWCLAARADLEVRRAHARDAERYVAEAEAIGDAVPKTVRGDLVLLRAQIALLEGDGRAALEALAKLDGDLRKSDALVDARAFVLEARARLCLLPADRRGAARAAVASLRRARAAELDEAARDAASVLQLARGKQRRTPDLQPRPIMTKIERERDTEPGGTWEVLRALASEPAEVCLNLLAAMIVRSANAERTIIAALDDDGDVVRAWGVDLDGLAIAEPAQRVERAALRAARSRAGVLYQPDVATAAGTGSRLALARERVALVVEHRFRAGAFDHVSEASCVEWLTLATIALRLSGSAAAPEVGARALETSAGAPTAAPSRVGMAVDMSTAIPTREPLRDYPDIVGRSPALRRALAQLDAAIDTALPVLVEGETGTGKELFGRALHDHGRRHAGPFVAVNCAAIADALFEAELFGHARGAFTGADRARGGLLARAEGGTLLLDEIGELPLARQATLLRVLEERRYRPVGSDDDRAFDVRIVAATNRDLDACVSEGTFRKDLLYRLRVLRVVVPPLRDRRGDVEILLRHFLGRAGSRVTVAPAALELLDAYSFPGNVRELEHVAQRLAASPLARVDVANLPRAVRAASLAGGSTTSPVTVLGTADAERQEVERALTQTGGNISRAAGLLGITRHGLKKRMLRLGLRGKVSAS